MIKARLVKIGKNFTSTATANIIVTAIITVTITIIIMLFLILNIDTLIIHGFAGKNSSISSISSIIDLAIKDYSIRNPPTTEQMSSAESSISKSKPIYVIFVEIEDSKMYLLKNGKLFKIYKISSGEYSTPSPLGTWKIINKSDWGEGFGGRWIGFDVPWGKYGIHGTIFPNSIGWASSHGCIRMYNEDVRELYRLVPHGTKVIIVNGGFGAFGKGFRTIRPGSRGSDVMEVQKRLKELGFFGGWVSGIYTEEMKLAVHKFQKAYKLSVRNEIGRRELEKMGFREFE